MAIPDNYIDKITKEGDSRMISPAAKMVRVNNENFEGSDLDEVLDEVSAAIDEAGSGGYAPPPGGIPATDLAPAVQTSLGKADSAYQKPASGIPASDIAPGVIPDVSGLATKTEVNTGLAGKVDKVTGKGLSANDYTTAEKNKLAGIQSGAEVNPTFATINGSRIDQGGNIQVVGAQGPKGDKGDTVVIGDEEEFTIVNDLTTGGESDALSAEMGKRLALTTGTYEQAWQRSKVITGLFSFIWDEMGFKKPIWHVGNSVFVDAAGGIVSAAQAANVPADPTFTSNGSSISDNSSVAKNTQVTITPATNSVLYYRIGSSGDYTASLSAVTLTLATAGSVVLSAYCVNTKGNSNTSTLNLTVEGTQVPTFAAKSGTTIDNNDVVSRGGYVVITGAVGGTLKYKVGSASSYTEVASVGDTAPSAEVQITGATTIKAYNVVDGDNSDEITKNYTMAALAAPTLTMNATSGDPTKPNEFPENGGTVEITHTDSNNVAIYYTTDGSTPTYTDQNTHNGTLYTTPISVTEGKTIKAIAVDAYGTSAVAAETYTVYVDNTPKFKFKIRLTADGSTEYVPTLLGYATVDGVSTRDYKMTVDWGDGSESTFNSYIQNKACSHTYTNGHKDDEYIITLKANKDNGQLVIPSLLFGGNANTNASSLYNPGSLVAIIENTLTCETVISLGGTNVESVCLNVMRNNIGTWTTLPVMSSYPAGLLSNLTKTGHYLTSAKNMLRDMPSTCVLTTANMNELASSITHVTNFGGMFYNFAGVCDIPDTFFDGLADESVTDFGQMVDSSDSGASCTVTGDSTVLTAVINQKKTSNATTTMMLRGLKPRS